MKKNQEKLLEDFNLEFLKGSQKDFQKEVLEDSKYKLPGRNAGSKRSEKSWRNSKDDFRGTGKSF